MIRWRIVWFSPKTGASGHGKAEYTDEQTAKREAKRLNVENRDVALYAAEAVEIDPNDETKCEVTQ